MPAFIYIFYAFFVAVAIFVVVTAIKNGKNLKNKKGDFMSSAEDGKVTRSESKPADGKADEKVFEELSAKNDGELSQKPATVTKPAAVENVSPVHANCDHAKTPSPYIDVNDTYSMTWDTFKAFILKLLSAEYPSAAISPYKYRGSPDIQLNKGGANVDVRLIFLRENVVVGKDDFNAALRDVDEKDDVSDWILTNGRFSLAQKTAASAKNVALYDVDDLSAAMRRCNISAKDK